MKRLYLSVCSLQTKVFTFQCNLFIKTITYIGNNKHMKKLYLSVAYKQKFLLSICNLFIHHLLSLIKAALPQHLALQGL